jgi:hypothetical protein
MNHENAPFAGGGEVLADGLAVGFFLDGCTDGKVSVYFGDH